MAKATKKRASGSKSLPSAASDASEIRQEKERANALEAPSDEAVSGDRTEATREDAEPTEVVAAEKKAVSRTPLRAAGSIRDTNREVAMGIAAGGALFGIGAYVVYWSSLRWLVAGGSSTMMAVSFLLPVTVPILIGSILGERGRKSLGYSMIGGVMLGTVIAGMYLTTRFRDSQNPMSAVPSIGPAPAVPPP